MKCIIFGKNQGVALSTRGASGGIGTIWNVDLFNLEESHKATNWIMVELNHLPSGMIFHLFNVYMLNSYREKTECWESLLGLEGMGYAQNCIIDRDFNTTIHIKEKRGGSIV